MTTRWLVVAGGVKAAGGQDRANLELVRFLSKVKGDEVHVIAHHVDSLVREWPGVHLHLVTMPLGSTFLGERLLEARARALKQELGSGTFVVSNGGNCLIGDVVWIHCVHAAWPVYDQGAPIHRRVLNRLKKWDARRREARALQQGTLIVANSTKTACDLVQYAGVRAEKIRVIYFGSDPGPTPERAALPTRQIAFVGALGWDQNKGIDIALRALALLARRPSFVHRLIVAGAGSSVPAKRLARALGLADRVDFIGLIDDVPGVLSRSDLLISPSRYEAYGLAVHEALVAGVPVIVSSDAGVAERFPLELAHFRVEEKENPEAWADRIRVVLEHLHEARSRIEGFQHFLAQRTWGQMACELVESAQLALAAKYPFVTP